MPHDRLDTAVQTHVAPLERAGTAKGAETVVTAVIPPEGNRGPGDQRNHTTHSARLTSAVVGDEHRLMFVGCLG